MSSHVSSQMSYYIIRSRLNNLRIDVPSKHRLETGTPVTAWLAKNWSDQLWYDHPDTGTIRWKKTDHCLDLEDDIIVVNPYCHGNAGQLWRRDGPLIRQNSNPSQVIRVEENFIPGAKVTVGRESGSVSEQFDFVHIPGLDEPYERRMFYIVSEYYSRVVLDVRRERATAGTDVIIWPKKSRSQSKNQLWYFDTHGVIRSALNDLVIEAQYGSSAKTAAHERRACQEWTVVEQGLISKTGECLELNEDEVQDGSAVYSAKFYDNPNQRWRLEYA